MASYNKVILMGHLTRDPEQKELPSGTPVCEFGLGVNRRWKDAQGADKEEVLFVDCTAFGKVGQTIATHLTKGRAIHVEGHLKLDQWEAEDGTKRSKIKVIVEQFRFVDSKGKDGGDQGTAAAATESACNRRVNGTAKGRGGRTPTNGAKTRRTPGNGTATHAGLPLDTGAAAADAPQTEDVPF